MIGSLPRHAKRHAASDITHRQPLLTHRALRLTFDNFAVSDRHVNPPSQSPAMSSAVGDDTGDLFLVRMHRPVVCNRWFSAKQHWASKFGISLLRVNVRKVFTDIVEQRAPSLYFRGNNARRVQ